MRRLFLPLTTPACFRPAAGCAVLLALVSPGHAADVPSSADLHVLADKGDVTALFKLGAQAEASGNTASALQFYLKAAQQGYLPAEFNVGNLYAGGVGVKQDSMEAAVWFRQAADQGLPEAQYNLALAYEKGRGVAQDYAQAVKWYQLASDKKYPQASYNLGVMAEDGRGMDRNDQLAATLYRKAAEQNFGPAQNNLGIMIAEGRGGLDRDETDACAWLALAVENGAKPMARDIMVHRLNDVQMADARVKLALLRNRLGLPPSSQSTEMPAAPAPVMPVPAVAESAPADTVGRLEAEIAAARAENARLLEDSRRLALDKADLEKKLAGQSGAPVPADRTDLARQLQASQEALKELADENLRLKSSGAPAASTLTDAGSTDDAAKLKEALADAQSRLGSITEDNHRLNNEVKRSIFELGSLRHEIDVLRQHADERSNASADSGPKTSSNSTASDEEIARIKNEVVGLKAENTRLSASLEDARATIAQSQSSAEQNGALKKRLDETLDELAKVRMQLAAVPIPVLADGDGAMLKANQEQLMTTNSRLAANLRGQTENAAALQAQLSTAEKNLADARGQADADRKQLQASIDRLAAEKTASPAGVQSQRDIKKLNEQLAELNGALASAATRQQLTQAKVDEVTAKLGATEQKLADASGNAASEKSTLQSRIDQLTRDNQRLTDAANQPKTDLDQLGKQVAELKGALAAVTTQRQTEQLKTEEVAAQLASVQQKLAEAIGRAAADQVNSKTSIDALTEQIAQMKTALASAQSDQQSQQTKATQLAAQLETVNRDLAAKQQTITDLNTKITGLSQAAAMSEQNRVEATQLRANVASLQRDVETLQKTIADDREKNTADMAAAAAQLKRVRDANHALAETNKLLIDAKAAQ